MKIFFISSFLIIFSLEPLHSSSVEEDDIEEIDDDIDDDQDSWKKEIPNLHHCDLKSLCDLTKCPCVQEYIKLTNAKNLEENINIYRANTKKASSNFKKENHNYENIEIKSMEKLQKNNKKHLYF